MEIRVKRNQYESAAGYTHARLLTEEGGFLCWTLEDETAAFTRTCRSTRSRPRR